MSRLGLWSRANRLYLLKDMNPRAFPLTVAVLLSAMVSTSNLFAQSRKWGPEQATGAPDTITAGDFPTAWASRQQDVGQEWLEVEFQRPVAIAEVRIWETFNPGAINKVVALPVSATGEGVVIWEGEAERASAPHEMVVQPRAPVASNRIKIHVDTTRVRGWNEIDAVELVGRDGSRQWAKRASASSFYGDGGTAQDLRPRPGPQALVESPQTEADVSKEEIKAELEIIKSEIRALREELIRRMPSGS